MSPTPTKKNNRPDDQSTPDKHEGQHSQRQHRGGRRFNGARNINGGGPNKDEVGIAPPPGFKPRTDSEMSEDEGACHVCLNKMTVFSVGECNHPVCYVCSTRMRVLCNRNECAICRQDLPKVVFTSAELKFDVIKDNIYPMDRKFKICFETEEIQNEYTELLDHKCPICTEEKVTFRTFRQLDQHVRREHESYFCDLCVNHLKLFTHERKLYNRKLLVEHRRKGDSDDTSFKGHPLCEFCEQRHIDPEELFKHLRKDHYFCHFCDADGHQYFFSEYPDLRNHFDKDHYLCEETECGEKKFVVFRTEIDLKGHKLEAHSGALSKAASKETRKVELEFSYSSKREERAERGGRHRGRDHGRSETPESAYVDQLDGPVRQTTEQVPDFTADFPTLSGETRSTGTALSGARSGEQAKKLAQATGHNTGVSGQTWSNKGGSIKVADDEFPSLPGARPVAPPPSTTSYAPNLGSRNVKKETSTVSKRSKLEEFPGLPTASKPLPKQSSQFRTVKPAIQSKAISKSRPSEPPKSNKPPGMRLIDARIKDDSDEDIPRHEEPSLDLNNFSRLTVKDSGQDLSYTSSHVGSNIMTIDRKVLEAQTGTNNSSSMSSNKANLGNENFPGLGAPQRTLNLNTAVVSGKKNKNKNKAKENNNNMNKPRTANISRGENSSLSGICDFLGGSEVKKPVHNEPAKPPDLFKEKKIKKTDEKKVKPIVSKTTVDDQLYRPSKEKKAESKPKETHTKKDNSLEEDFPSLGGNSKKLSANFVKKEDKLIKQPQVNSKWNGTDSESKANLLQYSDIKTQDNKTKNVPSVPPGFGVEKTKTKSRTPPGFGSKIANEHKRDSNLKYCPPSNFQERNHKLISTIASLVGGKSLEFGIFKEISGQFRAGKLTSDNYFSQCRELVSTDKFVKFFPELLVLLPDIDKQLELLSLYSKHEEDRQLVKCPVCYQVCLLMDKEEHGTSHHLDEDFPQL